ncbi:hypothetical protein MO867_09165 [Microbulbifer sp. OS29]|uniref:Uncharacterized protein n=1 Tax=Microbulbifer okhotskensis TaxID=2926617 RepID=A0A9X2EMP8_9GAMM|nr:hypothetical protein [Microbulbifer okhotskensis]MCO1334509.1 hypothetical protein [Microbulbifer okhotskensis]
MTTLAITEKPILLNTEMVRAILDDRKTQTRIKIEPHPLNGTSDKEAIKVIGGLPPGLSLLQLLNSAWCSGHLDIDCPYGEPGDRL